MEMKTKRFTNLEEAKQFAKEHKGFYEGAFYDENLNTTWVVFYRENK